MFALLSCLSSLPLAFAGYTGYYVAVPQALNFDDANAYCLSQYGTELASVHSSVDQANAQSLCQDIFNGGDKGYSHYSTLTYCWLGMYGEFASSASGYYWVDGTSKNYFPPLYSITSYECVEIHSDDGSWGDWTCATRYLGFICNKQPTVAPTVNPTPLPTSPPSSTPSRGPTQDPSQSPTRDPTAQPSGSPSKQPTDSPTTDPTQDPTVGPTRAPTSVPTWQPTANPTKNPTQVPSQFPTLDPSATPSDTPTKSPTEFPTADPTVDPTVDPSTSPTVDPTASPNLAPTVSPTVDPTDNPTGAPTDDPSASPTRDPSASPTDDPSESPTDDPSVSPTEDPSASPTKDPSASPTDDPSASPTDDPISLPTDGPTNKPSIGPTRQPSHGPTTTTNGESGDDEGDDEDDDSNDDDAFVVATTDTTLMLTLIGGLTFLILVVLFGYCMYRRWQISKNANAQLDIQHLGSTSMSPFGGPQLPFPTTDFAQQMMNMSAMGTGVPGMDSMGFDTSFVPQPVPDSVDSLGMATMPGLTAVPGEASMVPVAGASVPVMAFSMKDMPMSDIALIAPDLPGGFAEPADAGPARVMPMTVPPPVPAQLLINMHQDDNDTLSDETDHEPVGFGVNTVGY